MRTFCGRSCGVGVFLLLLLGFAALLLRRLRFSEVWIGHQGLSERAKVTVTAEGRVLEGL